MNLWLPNKKYFKKVGVRTSKFVYNQTCGENFPKKTPKQSKPVRCMTYGTIIDLLRCSPSKVSPIRCKCQSDTKRSSTHTIANMIVIRRLQLKVESGWVKSYVFLIDSKGDILRVLSGLRYSLCLLFTVHASYSCAVTHFHLMFKNDPGSLFISALFKA